MPSRKTTQVSKKPRLIPTLALLLAVGVLLATAGFGFAATQESRDPFCGSCHSLPESTFVARAAAASPADLASYHTTVKTRCIDCHSGQGLSGRLSAELMGAHNALAWFTKTAVQPAVLTKPYPEANCLKCHSNVTSESYVIKNQRLPGSIMGEGRAGHWHQFLPRWQSVDSKAATCVSCHGGHADGRTADNGFMDIPQVENVCNACHQTVGRD
jgi:hypothetical protein